SEGVRKNLLHTEAYINNHSGFDEVLLELVRLRSSQINGCAYCIDMHSKNLRAAGEENTRIDGLVAWRDTPFYSDRERAALEWAEAVTLVAVDHVPDEVFARVRPHFSDEELVHLTLAITMINTWNRFSVSFRAVPGEYQAPKKAPAAGKLAS
ncbi:MAG: carboxymuconolactone decarboxylase family protein, partial [Terriglobales bacterium]